MKSSARRWSTAFALGLALAVFPDGAAVAVQPRPKTGRFDALAIDHPARVADVATTPAAALPPGEPMRKRWDDFRAAHGQAWSVYLDRRSGAPLLVEGNGIPWPVAPGATVDSLAASLRAFVAAHRALCAQHDQCLGVGRIDFQRLLCLAERSAAVVALQ